MSTSGVSGNLSQLESMLNSAQQFLSDFKQLGTDLQSGNTSAAQQDFVTLSKDVLASSSGTATTSATTSTAASTSATSTAASTAPQSKIATLENDFQTLSQDLNAGNLSGAQQAYSQISQDMKSSGGHHQHHAHSSGTAGSSSGLQALLASLSTSGTNSSSSTSSSSSSNSTSSSASTADAAATSSTASAGNAATTISSAEKNASVLMGDIRGIAQAFRSYAATGQSTSSSAASSSTLNVSA